MRFLATVLAVAQQEASPIRKFLRINDQFCTGGQPRVDQLAELKASGVKTIINLRTPGEYHSAEEEEQFEPPRHEERQGNQRNHEKSQGIHANQLCDSWNSRRPLILGVLGVLAVRQLPFLGLLNRSMGLLSTARIMVIAI
jgi:hypothetical protein